MIKSSIIIPTAGRPVAIKSAIQSLLMINPEQYDAEIIVVDNNTSDELSSDLAAYCNSLKERVRYVQERSIGLSAARHRGAYLAEGELLTFIDDDIEVSTTWLPAIQRGFADPSVAMVGGPSIPKFTCSIPAWFWDFLGPTPYGGWMCSWLSLLDIGRDVMDVNPNYIWGLNFSIRKKAMNACGGFHPDLVPKAYQRWQGDGESGLTMNVQNSEYRAAYIQDAMLLHLCNVDRLNTDYFQKRAYFQGVCDSFTQIRSGRPPLKGCRPSGQSTLYSGVRSLAGRVYKSLRGQRTLWSREGALVKNLTMLSYREGWEFHQREVAADPELLEWVRRKDYLESHISDQHQIVL